MESFEQFYVRKQKKLYTFIYLVIEVHFKYTCLEYVFILQKPKHIKKKN